MKYKAMEKYLNTALVYAAAAMAGGVFTGVHKV